MPDAATTLQILGGGTPPQGDAQPSDSRQASATIAQPTSNSDTALAPLTLNSDQATQPVDDIQNKMDILAGKTRVDAPAKQQSSSVAPAAPKSGPHDFGALNAGANSATSMMTFGLDKPVDSLGIGAIDYATDKARGAMGAQQKHPGNSFGDYYDRAKAGIEAQDAAADQQHPIASAVGDVAGFAGSMGLGAPKAAAAIPAATSAVKTALKSSAINGVVGSLIGGIDALGNAKGDAGERLSAGAHGAETGGIIGATVPVGLQAAGKVIGKVAAPLIDPIINRFSMTHDEHALNKIAQQFGRDDMTPDQVRQALAGMGPEAAIVDSAGANTQGLARGIAGMPGEAKQQASEFFDQRQAGQGTRVNDATAKGLGVNQSYYDAEEALQNQQKQAHPLYSDAYAENQNINSPAISKILRTPAGQKALSSARVLMQNDMTLMGVPDKELAEQAKLVGSYKPGGIASGLKLRTLDYVKRALDDQVGALQRAGEGNSARILGNLKRNLVGELDRADTTAVRDAAGNITAPGKYSQARAMYAGPAQSQEALEAGRGFINNDAELTNRAMASMSPGEKEMFRVGAARALRDKIMNTAYGADSVKNIFGAPDALFGSAAKREKMQTLFPDQQSFNDFEKQMMSEAKMYSTRAGVTQGSRTAPMGEEMHDSGLDPGHIMEIAKGNWHGAAAKIGMNMLTKLQMPEEVRTLIANKLFTNDRAENAKTLQQLEQILGQNANKKLLPPFKASPGLAGQIGNTAGSVTAGSGQP